MICMGLSSLYVNKANRQNKFKYSGNHLKRASLFPALCFLIYLISMRTTDLALPTTIHLLVLQTLHYNLRVIFLVVLAFFLKMGLVCPP